MAQRGQGKRDTAGIIASVAVLCAAGIAAGFVLLRVDTPAGTFPVGTPVAQLATITQQHNDQASLTTQVEPPSGDTASGLDTAVGVDFRWHLALLNGTMCMDGSQSGVYVRKPIRPGVRRWAIVFADGVGWCNHFSNCRARGFGAAHHASASSHLWTDVPKWGQGLFASQTNDLKDFNVVGFGYCDGSLFTGGRAKVTLVGGKPYLFGGRANLEEMLRFVKGLGVSKESEVSFIGVGIGMSVISLHLHTLHGALSRWGVHSTMRVILDGEPHSVFPSTTMGREEIRRMAMASVFWNASAALSPTCREAASRIAPMEELGRIANEKSQPSLKHFDPKSNDWRCLFTDSNIKQAGKMAGVEFLVVRPSLECTGWPSTFAAMYTGQHREEHAIKDLFKVAYSPFEDLPNARILDMKCSAECKSRGKGYITTSNYCLTEKLAGGHTSVCNALGQFLRGGLSRSSVLETVKC